MADPKIDLGYGTAKIVGDEILIRIPIDTLPLAMEGACDMQAVEPRYRVTDPAAFAEGFVWALNQEEEDGTTRIHKLFDEAMNAALDMGTEGVVEVPDVE
jgi:hypothetical protein